MENVFTFIKRIKYKYSYNVAESGYKSEHPEIALENSAWINSVVFWVFVSYSTFWMV